MGKGKREAGAADAAGGVEPVVTSRTHAWGLRFLGGGFLIGLAARDLSPDDVRRYGADLCESGVAQGLYVWVEAPPAVVGAGGGLVMEE